MKKHFTSIRQYLLGCAVVGVMGLGTLAHGAPVAASMNFKGTKIDKSVTGQVLSVDDNTPIPGVSVVLKGTRTGTNTDADGKFKIDVPDNAAVLVISSVGFVTQEIPVGAKSEISISLVSDMKSLSEVVVVGYGTQKKARLPERFHLFRRRKLLRCQ